MYTTIEDQTSGRNGITHIEPDGDFLDSQMGEVMGFSTTGFADEPPVAEVANLLADVADTLLGEVEQRMNITEAKAMLAANAPGVYFGLSEMNSAYVGIDYGFFKDVCLQCEVRVINPNNKAECRVFTAEGWRDACNAALMALFGHEAA